jgi:hypothetical protein
MGLLSCGLGDDVVPERVGEDENHRDHEAVDGRGLDHRQTDEQGPGDGGGGVGLLRQRTQRGRDRLPFASAGPMVPKPVVMPAVTIDATAIRVMLSIA